MLKKMNEKKNNKGFSLVELIVVILIMAVLAVALAPQVMRWVDNARLANDKQTVESIMSGLQLALAEEGGKAYDIEIKGTKNNPWQITRTGAPTEDNLNKVLGTNWKNSKLQSAATITITASGASISYDPAAAFDNIK